MTEITALVRRPEIQLGDIKGYHGDPRIAYQAVVSGLGDGTITAPSLPIWELVGCMQYAIPANSQDWYAELEERARYPEHLEEALILRNLLLDATLEMMAMSSEGVKPDALLQVLTEKAVIERFYGVPVGRSFEESVERCLREAVPVDQDAIVLLRLNLYESARASPQNHVLARRVADTFVTEYQRQYSSL